MTTLDRGSSGFTVAIPNRYEDIIQPLISSIRRYEPDADVLIVRDGHSNDYGFRSIEYSYTGEFRFGAAANLALRHSGSKDVILINDDCILIHDRSLSRLHETAIELAARGHRIGLFSPLIKGAVGNRLQSFYTSPLSYHHAKSDSILLKAFDSYLCFPCVWISKQMFLEIGPMLELPPYGGEDVDYSRRAKNHSWQIGVTKRSVVQHGNGTYSDKRGGSWNLSYVRRYPEIYQIE